MVPYRPQMNGVVEGANKNIKKILVKITDTYKDWQEYLPYAHIAFLFVLPRVRPCIH